VTAAENDQRGMGYRLTGLLSWWIETLVAGLPAWLRRCLGIEPDRLLLEPAADGLAARLARAGRTQALPAVAGDEPPSAWREAARQALVTLRLPAATGLLRPVELPAAAAENLGQVLRFEMDRLTPFQASQVYFGHRLLGREGDRLRALLWAVPRARVDAELQAASRAGLAVAAVELAEAGPLTVPGLARPPGGIGWLNGLLLAFLAAQLLAALAVPFWQGRQRLTELAGAAVQLRPAAEEAAALLRERERLSGGGERAFRGKAAAGSVAVLLEDLSNRLPDEAWLGQFNLVDGRVELEGSTTSTAALVPVIEASPHFGKVSFRAPVVSDPVSRREQFQLSVEVRRR